MPRKIYDDKKLRPEALKLRKRASSCRKIAERFGCSVYRVHKLISEHESPSPRLKQAVELASRLDGLSSKLNTLEMQVSKLQSSISSVKTLEDLTKEVSKLRKEVEGFNRKIKDLADTMNWIRRSAENRLRDDRISCKWLDGNGYCTFWYWHEKVRGWNMRSYTVKGRTVYRLNVKWIS